MLLNPYLIFNGNCREAFEFYRSIFGGEFSNIETFASAPDKCSVPEAERNHIMHVCLPVGSVTHLMGCDSPSQMPPLVAGNNFSISVRTDSKEECDTLFAKLSEGGSATMSPQKTFWGGYFAMCTDKFDTRWMIVVYLAE